MLIQEACEIPPETIAPIQRGLRDAPAMMALIQRGLRDAKAQVMQPDGALALECHVDVGVHGRYSQVRGHLMCAIMSYAYVQQHDMCVFRLYIDSIIIYIFYI